MWLSLGVDATTTARVPSEATQERDESLVTSASQQKRSSCSSCSSGKLSSKVRSWIGVPSASLLRLPKMVDASALEFVWTETRSASGEQVQRFVELHLQPL